MKWKIKKTHIKLTSILLLLLLLLSLSMSLLSIETLVSSEELMYFYHDAVIDGAKSTPLCEIMGRNGSDKGHNDVTKSHHNYTTFYHHIFKDIKLNNLNIFELGLGTMGGRPGASLHGWSEFFPNSQIYGADIDKSILFQKDRIKTYYCDQTNKEDIDNMWNLLKNEKFDIMIEDGLHEFNANVCFFENSIHKLSKNGFYIIEDISFSIVHLFEKKIIEWIEKYDDLNFYLLKIPSIINHDDNNLLVVTYKS